MKCLARHFISDKDKNDSVIKEIKRDLIERTKFFNENEKFLEEQRISQRTNFDIEMIQEIGYCSGIENYSRYFDGRKEGERPFTLIDFFPEDFLTVIDESHVTLPQIQAMYGGDRKRKDNLIDYGFRLPSAYDNRPLKSDEFSTLQNQVIYASATPSHRELELSQGAITELINRPTGLVDPELMIRPSAGQIDDLISEIKIRSSKDERCLVTTLTKKMAEDLSEYLSSVGLRVRYLHSEVKTIERVKILRDLRLGDFDVLVGINLLREGLDLPEVSLVATNDTSGRSNPSLNRLIPTKTSKSPNLKSLKILTLSMVFTSEWRYLTLKPTELKYSDKSSAIFLVNVVTKHLSSFDDLIFISEIRSSIWPAEGLIINSGSTNPVGLLINSVIAPWDSSNSLCDGVADA